ncbi:MAG TPA: hypothetical protein VFV50_08580 [Bdellovibrionales bacterium]|nr:hypothetical protein [Bdellovibrionales bacterium]
MSKKEVTAQKKPEAAASTGPSGCVAEGCKQKSSRLNFCAEHYDWFKAGLVTKEGVRPKDFDKKWINYTRKKAAA